MKQTAMDYLRRAKQVAAGVDAGKFELAQIALEMREAKIDRWAAKLAALPNVRRAESTMYEWARSIDFHNSLRRKFKLPFSFFVAAERHANRIELTEIEELLEAWEIAEGATLESFSAMLRDRIGMTPEGPDLERTLADLTRLRDRLSDIGKRAGLPTDVYYALTAAGEALTPAFEAFAARLYADGEKAAE